MNSQNVIKLLSSEDPESISLGINLFKEDYDWRKLLGKTDIVARTCLENWNFVISKISENFTIDRHFGYFAINYNKSRFGYNVCYLEDFVEFVRFYYGH